MNYYPHHIGDYAKDASHLTMLEDGAYRRMMDTYYSTERPLPIDRAALYRLVRAQTRAEKVAVDSVLQEFFKEQDDGWHSKRCDEEIGKAQVKSAKAAASAGKRWQNEGRADAMRTHNEGNAPNNQEPITKNQESTARQRATPAKRKSKTPLPPDFRISERVTAWAASKGFDRLDLHLEAFKSKCRKNDYRYADWDEAFMEAVRENWAKLPAKGNGAVAHDDTCAHVIDGIRCGKPGAFGRGSKWFCRDHNPH